MRRSRCLQFRGNVIINTCASVMKESVPGSTALELPPSCGPYAGTPLIDIPIIPLIGISVMVDFFSGCNGIYWSEKKGIAILIIVVLKL